MDGEQPRLLALSLFVKNMTETLAFYRRLGLVIPEGVEQSPHVAVEFPGGTALEFDTIEMTKAYDRAWREPTGGSRDTFQFLLPSREAVDELFGTLTGAGHHGHLAPFDAFWGARYAVVEDPDGNLVGLTSVQDPARGGPVPSGPS